MIVCPQTNSKVFKMSCKDCRERDTCEAFGDKTEVVLYEEDQSKEETAEDAASLYRKRQLVYAALGITGFSMFVLAALTAKSSIYLTAVFVIIGAVLIWIEAARGIRSDVKGIKELRGKIKQKGGLFKKKQEFFPDWQQYFNKQQ